MSKITIPKANVKNPNDKNPNDKNQNVISVNDKMQKNYSYVLSKKIGDFSDLPGFTPFYTPKEMLDMGVFEGKYCTDCTDEFPKSWFASAKLSPEKSNPCINYFGVKSRLSLQEWISRGWIPIAPGDKDIRGWFQWYMRTYYGRRDPNVDHKQVARWRSFVRHAGQVKKNCHHQKDNKGRCTRPLECRPIQRQALLQWSHDCLI